MNSIGMMRVWSQARHLRFTLLILAAAVCRPALAQSPSPIRLSPDSPEFFLGKSMQILEDPRGEFSYPNLPVPGWSASPGDSPSYGFSNSIYWVRFSLQCPASGCAEYLLEMGYPMIDQVELFEGTSGAHRVLGDRFPFSNRQIHHRNVVFPVRPSPGLNEYTLRFQTTSSMNLPVRLWTQRIFAEKTARENLVLGIYYGIMIVMLVYNLFLYMSVRDLSYLYYVVFLAGYILFQVTLNGLAFEYFWPDSIWWANACLPLFIFFGTAGSLQFSRSYLNTGRTAPVINRIMIALLVLTALGAPVSLFLKYSIAIRAATGIVFLCVLTMMAAGYICLARGYRPARYYSIAWTVLLAGVAIYALKTFAVLPENFFTSWIIQIGSAMEVVLLSLGLADRINILKHEKEIMHMDMLDSRLRMLEATSRFVPDQFLEFLGRVSILDVQRGDSVQKHMTVLFADIRKFTSLSEQLSSTDTFKFLNAYLERMGPPVHKNNGFIDKFIGDAIFALFPESGDDAVRCAVQMKHELEKYNRHRRQSGYREIDTGFGLNSGELMLGTVGTAGRLDTTVIGDTVNLAARLEKLTKYFRVSIILTDFCYRQLKNPAGFLFREIDSVRVAGKEKPVVLYECFDADPEPIKETKLNNQSTLQLGMFHYKAGDFQEALRIFYECKSADDRLPDLLLDPLPAIYQARCEKLISAPPQKWSGVSRMRR